RPPLRASAVASCTVSSSLPIPARNKQDMQPNPPSGVFSSGPPQLGHVGVSLANGTLGIKVKSHVKIKPASRVTVFDPPHKKEQAVSEWSDFDGRHASRPLHFRRILEA